MIDSGRAEDWYWDSSGNRRDRWAGLGQRAAGKCCSAGPGHLLVAYGAYEVYYKPNVRLDWTITRWLEQRYWTVKQEASVSVENFHFAIWAHDEANRKIMISREKPMKGILAFTAPIDLDGSTVRQLGAKLSTVEQQKLYEELHVVLASMHLGYNSEVFTKMAVQRALPIDERLSANAVDLEAKYVLNGVIAARSTIRKAVK